MPEGRSQHGKKKAVDTTEKCDDGCAYVAYLLLMMAVLAFVQISVDWWGLTGKYIYRTDIEQKLVRELCWQRDINKSFGERFNHVIDKEHFDFSKEMRALQKRIKQKNSRIAISLGIPFYLSWVYIVWLILSWKQGDILLEADIRFLYALFFGLLVLYNPVIRCPPDYRFSYFTELLDGTPVKAVILALAWVSWLITTLICMTKYNIFSLW